MIEKHHRKRFLSLLVTVFLVIQTIHSGVVSFYDAQDVTEEEFVVYESDTPEEHQKAAFEATVETLEVYEKSVLQVTEEASEAYESVSDEDPETSQGTDIYSEEEIPEEYQDDEFYPEEEISEEYQDDEFYPEEELPEEYQDDEFYSEEEAWEEEPMQKTLRPVVTVMSEANDTKTYVVIRHHHPDGTVQTETAALSYGQSFEFNASGYMDGETEVFSGAVETAGNSAVNINGSTVTVNWQEGVTLAKAEVFYSEKLTEKAGGMVNGDYDTEMKTKKIYDTSRSGLHTDKNAEVVSDRIFDLTLESWYVGKSADVTMILDASGSMAWPIDEVKPLVLENYSGSYTDFLTERQVDAILDKNYTDNTKMQYSGYYYFIDDEINNEKVALGYAYIDNYNYNITISGKERSRVKNNRGETIGFTDSATNPKSGWYYVNTTSDNGARTGELHAMKYYEAFYKDDKITVPGICANSSVPAGTPIKFFVRRENNQDVLYCVYSYGTEVKNDKDSRYGLRPYHISKVYTYDKTTDDVNGRTHQTKIEALQEGVGVYQSIMSSEMPSTQTSIVRFSSHKLFSEAGGYNNDGSQLIVLDWTSDSQTIINAIGQTYGTDVSGTTTGAKGKTQYNYFLTGGTFAYTGLDSFQKYLQGTAKGERDNSVSDKYIILFTDGRDQEKTDSDEAAKNPRNLDKAEQYVQNLKNAGYNVITIFLQSDGMSSNDVSASETFLKGLASTITLKDNTTKEMYYHAVSANKAQSDSSKTMAEIFKDIANTISNALQNYTVRDYIDPRFDLLDKEGNVVTVLHADGTFPEAGIPYVTLDEKEATLYYDNAEKMFYLEWKGQDIPLAMQGTKELDPIHVWSSKVRVQAKDDFIGGNNVLTNGNEAAQNRVYFNDGKIDNLKTDTKYPAKDFPKTTVNPGLLEGELGTDKDTFFLGETVTADDFKNYYDNITKDKNNIYIKYLTRLAKHEEKSADDYIKQLLENGSLTLDYWYFKDPDDAASYAGDDGHEEEKIGQITYQWVECDADGNTIQNGRPYGSVNLDKEQNVYYKLEIIYTPDAFTTREGEFIDYNVPNTNVADEAKEKNLKREPVGAQRENENMKGIVTIDVVPGKLRIDKMLNYDDLCGLIDKSGEKTLKFNISREYNGTTANNYITVFMKLTKIKAVVSITRDGSTETLNEITLSDGMKDADGNITLQSAWITDLPLGTYTVTEDETSASPYLLNNIQLVELDSGLYPCEASLNGSSAVFKIGITDQQPDETVQGIYQKKFYLTKQAGEVKLLNELFKEEIFQIPSTGGRGDFLFIITGTAMLTAAWLRSSRRKRRKLS